MSTGKCRIRASTGNVGSGREPEMWDPSENRKCGIRASTGNVGSGRVPKIGDAKTKALDELN